MHKPQYLFLFICILITTMALNFCPENFNLAGEYMTLCKTCWDGWYIPHISSWLHASSSRQDCCHPTTHNPNKAPGTTIYSDQWRAYNRVASSPSVPSHSTVNHNYWARAKLKIKIMKGCHKQELPSYLDEFMWREWFRTTSQLAFQNII